MGSSLEAFIVSLIFIGVCLGAAEGIRSCLTIQLRERFIVSVRTSLYSHVLFIPIRYFRSERTGSIISRISQDTAQLQGMVLTQFPLTTSSLFTLLFAMGAIWFISPELTLILIAIFPIIWWGNQYIGRKIKHLTYLELEKLSDIFAQMGEAISGIETVKVHAAEHRESGNITQMVQDLGDIRINNSYLTGFGNSIRTMLQGGAIILIIWVGGNHVLEGTMSVGDFIAYMVYLPIIAASVQTLSSFPTELQRMVAAGGRIRELFLIGKEYEPDRPIRSPLIKIRGEIALRNVSFSYDGITRVLNNISVVFKPGEIIGIIGETGAGKTTLIQLILRFYCPDHGDILFDGMNIARIRHDNIREYIAFVSQDLFLFHDTVENNIRYSTQSASKEMIIDAARAAQIHDTISRFPNGYQTVVGERGLQLSAGQRQRISLARALLRNTPILILDEPSSSLDKDTEMQLLRTLEIATRGKTVIIITHRESILDICTKVFRIKNGTLQEEDKKIRTVINI